MDKSLNYRCFIVILPMLVQPCSAHPADRDSAAADSAPPLADDGIAENDY